MALEIKITASDLNDPANDTVRIYDDTTGVYNNPDNLTGYGAPNEERSNLAVYIAVLKKEPSGSDLSLTVPNDDSTADTVSSWSVTISEDGWYQAVMIAAPIWDAGTAYSIGQLVWYSDALYRVAIGTSAGESPVSAPSKYTTFESTGVNIYDVYINKDSYEKEGVIYTDLLDDFVTYRGDSAYKDIWQQASSINGDTGSVPERVYKLTAYLEGAKIAFARNRYAEADRKMNIVADLAAGNDCTSY